MSDNMADKLKRKLSGKNITAMILFGAIIMVFVFFGLPNTITGGMGAAARVNENFISLMEFQNATEQMEQMYSQYMGGKSFDPEQRKSLRMRTMQELIDKELTAQAARRAGIRATDVEVRDVITKEITAFQKDGQFQRENYTAYLQSQGLTPGDFESRVVRKQLESARIYRLFEASSRTLSLEAEKQKSLQNLKMNLLYVKFDDDKPTTQLSSNAEAQKALATDDFKKKIEAEFNLKKAQLSQPEQVQAQHILISFKPGDATSEKIALAKIQALKLRTAKEDFGLLASKNSEDPGSKAKKGDLGYFGRGAMVKEFEEVAFTLPRGQVSEIVKSPFGYHLIKVTDKKAAKEAQLSEHQLPIAKEILEKDAWQKKSQELEKLLSTEASQIDNEIKSLGAKWEETGFFALDSKSIPKIQELEIEKVAGLTAKQPYFKNFVRSGSSRFIVKLKEMKQEKDLETVLGAARPEFSQRKRADGVFTSWIQNFKKESDIETNSLIFQ